MSSTPTGGDNRIQLPDESEQASIPATPASPQEILESLTTDPNIYNGNIGNAPRRIDARPAVTATLSDAASALIDKDLMAAYFEHVADRNARELYCHQAETIEAILVEKRENICISTSTSSGKSLAFNLPILSRLLTDNAATALYLYPTKALTQDQKRVIDAVISKRRDLRGILGESLGVEAGILDGDVKELSARAEVTERCNLILSNPDLLHYSILPNHRKFAPFLSRLKYVVIDEAHCYNGSFGSHVASVLRRLRRVLASYNTDGSREPVQFISCSATIGNPGEHVSRLVGIECDKLITNDGSPSGERVLAVWNSASSESVKDCVGILIKFLTLGVRFICFFKNRFLIELVLKQVRDKLRSNPRLAEKIVSYRSGYSVEDRRDLEQKIFSGQVTGVVATTALELGMDIGSLDVSFTFGYPGSIHSLWQQWGRAGRGSRSCLCILLCQENDVVDQWIGQDDSRLLEEMPEDAVLQVANGSIVKSHLLCSDLEIRFMTPADWTAARFQYWPDVPEAVFLAAMKDAPFAKKKSFPIRNVDSRQVIVYCDQVKIDQLDISQAFFYVFPGAVHSVQGVEYRIVDLSVKTFTATAVKANHDYFTRPSDSTTITTAVPVTESTLEIVHTGRADVSMKVKGFYRISKKPPHDLVQGGFEQLELPTIKFATTAVWIDISAIDPLVAASGAHGAAHALFFASCQRLLLSHQSDIKCDCQIQNRSIMLYDAQNGGLGISEMIFKRITGLVHIALNRVTRCKCLNGCIKCLFMSKCSEGNRDVNKSSTVGLLKAIEAVVDPTHSSQ